MPPKELELLGSGRYASVHEVKEGNLVFAQKRYFRRNPESDQAFKSELEAYQIASKIDNLHDRIPKLYGFDTVAKSLNLELICGKTLRNALQEISFEHLNGLHETIRDTLTYLHEHGVCHGDVSLDNICLPAVLLDFSHANMLSNLSQSQENPERRWKELVRGDWDKLKDVFREAEGRKESFDAIALIDADTNSDSCRQERLAKLLKSAYHSKPLRSALKSLSTPTPCLALAMAQIFRRGMEFEVVVNTFEGYEPPLPPSEEDSRFLVKLKGEVARSRSVVNCKEGCKKYEEAVQYSVDTLGLKDKDTIMLQLAYVQCLEKSAQTRKALGVLNTIITNSSNSTYEHKLVEYKEKLSKRCVATTTLSNPRKRLCESGKNKVYVTSPGNKEKRICLNSSNSTSNKENVDI